MHAGESILVRVAVSWPDGRPLTAGPVTAEFWAPGRDPEHDPAVRADPDHRVRCSYDPSSRRWLAAVPGCDTASWPPGAWTMRGAVRGEADAWAWLTFGLAS